MTHDILMQETILFSLLILLAGFVLWLYYRRKQHMTNLEYHRLEVLNRMVDKFGSGQEFVTFLQTDQGKRLLPEASGQIETGRGSGKLAILRYIQVGVMLLVLGGGFMAQSDVYGPDTAYWGIMCFMLAIGLWIVAAITAVWNRMQRRATRRDLQPETARG